ncbi:MAG: hypothetical protein GY822_28925 [Deltaproteobacteria bacterium]|nr:hypothetical protein [Deltaproteobacteria bacterium]
MKFTPSHSEKSKLMRILATGMENVLDFSLFITTEEQALSFFQRVVNDGKCPVCKRRCRREKRKLICKKCPERTITFRTGMHHTRVSMYHWLAAIWHTNVDSRSIAARHFSRRYRLRRMTAWDLLHKTRAGTRYIFANTATTRMQILGRTNKNNVAFVNMATECIMTAVEDEDAITNWLGVPLKPYPVDALWLGHLRAWIVNVFHGVTKKHLRKYIAEFSRRHGRLNPTAIEVQVVPAGAQPE